MREPALEPAARVLRAIPAPSTLAALRAAHEARSPLALLHPASTADEERQLANRLREAAPLVPGLYISTSGSTGTPKVVELPWSAIAAHVHGANQHLRLRADDRWLVTLPLSHAGGASIVFRCLEAGAGVALEQAPALGPAFSAWMVDRAEALGISRLSLVPAQLERLLRDGARPMRALRSVLLGGQALSSALRDRAIDAGWPVVTSYGLTETFGVCVASDVGERLADGVVGRPLPGVRLRVPEGLLEVETAAMASRVLGGEGPSRDGWLRTQDRARLLDDGRLQVLGRADDLLVSAGHKIDPTEVEAALLRLPAVAQAAVAGRPDPIYGVIVTALVVPSHEVTEEAALLAGIDAELAALLPAYKRPRELRIVAGLPLLHSGKLDRAAVRALVAVAVSPRP